MTNDSRQMIAGSRIRSLRKRLKMTQAEFAAHLGLDGGAGHVSNMEIGRAAPSVDNAMKIAEIGGGNPYWYQGFDVDAPEIVVDKPEGVPLVGAVQAGHWREAVETPPDEWDLMPLPDPKLAFYNGLRAFEVVGNSMNLAVPHGSVVYVAGLMTNAILPRHGNMVLVQRRNTHDEYEVSLKRYLKRGRTEILMPESSDPEFKEPLDLAKGSHENDDVRITGVVVYDSVRGLEDNIGYKQRLATEDKVMMRHAKGMRHAEIAREVGVSRERVRQIVRKHGESAADAKERVRRLRVIDGGKPDNG